MRGYYTDQRAAGASLSIEHLEKPRITRLFDVSPVGNFNYRLVAGVINQGVTINTMEVLIHQPPIPYQFFEVPTYLSEDLSINKADSRYKKVPMVYCQAVYALLAVYRSCAI